MEMKPVVEIRNAVRNNEPTDLYGAVRMVTSSDIEAAEACNALIGGAGYDDLRELGLSLTEATRVMAIAKYIPTPETTRDIVAREADDIINTMDLPGLRNHLSNMVNDDRIPLDTARQMLKTGFANVAPDFHQAVAFGIMNDSLVSGTVATSTLLDVPEPVVEVIDPAVAALMGPWTDDTVISPGCRIGSNRDSVYGSVAGVNTAFTDVNITSHPSTDNFFFEFAAPEFIDPNQRFGLTTHAPIADETAELLGSATLAGSIGFSYMGQVFIAGNVSEITIPAIPANSTVSIVLLSLEGDLAIYMAIDGQWITDPTTQAPLFILPAPTDVRFGVTTYFAGAEHKVLVNTDSANFTYPVPAGLALAVDWPKPVELPENDDAEAPEDPADPAEDPENPPAE